MVEMQLKGLELLEWKTSKVSVTRTDVKNELIEHPVYSKHVIASRVKISGSLWMQLENKVTVQFGWIARQDIETGGATRNYEYEVCFREPAGFFNARFVDHRGEKLPRANYLQVAHWLARNTIPLWSEAVAHYLRSLR